MGVLMFSIGCSVHWSMCFRGCSVHFSVVLLFSKN